MRIAVPVKDNDQVDDHFGHCSFYDIFDISPTDEIKKMKRIPALQGCGCKSDIAGILAADSVSVMLAGGIGNGAINVLNNAGISVIRGCTGNSAEVVKNYLSGIINDSGVSCRHHAGLPGNSHSHLCSH